MRYKVAFIAAVAAVVGSIGACSSEQPAKPAPGVLASGTAQITIDGKDLPLVRSVECEPSEEYLTIIKTGDDKSGTTVQVSNAEKLAVTFARIRNVSGFTGDYDRDLGGTADIELKKNTYHIAGTAFGFSEKSPFEAVRTPFTLAVAC